MSNCIELSSLPLSHMSFDEITDAYEGDGLWRQWKENLSRCIKGIRVELIWSLLIIVQEISFDRRLFHC